MPEKLELFRLLQAPRAKDFVLCNSGYCEDPKLAFDFAKWAMQWVLEVVVNVMEDDKKTVASTKTYFCETTASSMGGLNCEGLHSNRFMPHCQERKILFKVYLHKKKQSKRVLVMESAGIDVPINMDLKNVCYATEEHDRAFQSVADAQVKFLLHVDRLIELAIQGEVDSPKHGESIEYKEFAARIDFWFAVEGQV